MRKRSLLLTPMMAWAMMSCISMQPKRIPESQEPTAAVAHLELRMRSGERFDLYDAIVRTDSIVGRTALVLDAAQRGVATADVAQLKEQRLSPLRTVALAALVAAGVLFTTVIVILAALFSGSL